MATISQYQLKSGKSRYEVSGYAGRDKGTGKQLNYHKMGFLSWREANDWAKQKESDLVKEKNNGRYRYNMLLKDWLNEWIDKRKINVKQGSMIIYRYNVEHYLIPNLGGYTLGEYSPTIHQQFIEDMLDHGGVDGKPLKYNTVNTMSGTLSNAFAKAVKLHYIEKNPTEGVEFPRYSKKSIPTLHYWTIPQADAFLAATKLDRNKTWYYFFLTVLDLGLRKGEAMALTWGDIDFGENTVDINKTRLYAAEKGIHAGEIILDDPKYPASVRTLFMTDRLHDELLKYKHLWYPLSDVIRMQDKTVAVDPDEFVFKHMGVAPYYGQVIGASGIDDARDRALKRIKPSIPKIKVHDLRHTLGVFMRESGVPLEDIKDVLGHKDISTTQIYAEITPRVKKAATDKLNQYLKNGTKKAPNLGQRVVTLHGKLH